MSSRLLPLAVATAVLTATPAFAGSSKPVSVAKLSNFSMRESEIRERLDNALMKDPNSVRLNFLSGLVYDMQSSSGSEGRQLARVGYLTSLRADPTFWPANYQLGLLAMEDGDMVSAEGYFIAAAFYAPSIPYLYYALARAAYCAGDVGNAGLALRKASSLAAPESEEELLTAALVSALQGDQGKAQEWLAQLKGRTNRPLDPYLSDRVASLLGGANRVTPVGPAPVSAAPTPPASGRRKMATVDVVIIRRKEARLKTTGINLMDALSLQFGSTLINSERNRAVDRNAGAVLSDTVNTVNNVNLTVPAVTYSLNLANAAGNKSSIDAKPTLLVYDGQTSKVFSGGTLTYAASGQLNSQSFTKEVGLSLSVTPKFNNDDTVTLTIATGLETFINTAAAGTFREAVQTDKSSTEITADLRFGDTVIVSGGRYDNFQVGASATPVLGSVPIIGNLFRETSNSQDTNDLLVLLSLRRESGGVDSDSPEEIDRVVLLGNRLWRKLGDVPVDNAIRAEPEHHSPYFVLGNPGRGFNRGYMELIGLDDMLIR